MTRICRVCNRPAIELAINGESYCAGSPLLYHFQRAADKATSFIADPRVGFAAVGFSVGRCAASLFVHQSLPEETGIMLTILCVALFGARAARKAAVFAEAGYRQAKIASQQSQGANQKAGVLLKQVSR